MTHLVLVVLEDRVLVHLEHSRMTTMTQLAKELHCPQDRVVTAVEELAKQGLVKEELGRILAREQAE